MIVRIQQNLGERAKEIAKNMPVRCSVTAIINRALELWLAVEGPVFESMGEGDGVERFKEAQKRIRLVKPDSVSENPAELQ